MIASGRFLPVKAAQCAGQIRCKRLSSRMQMGGQVHERRVVPGIPGSEVAQAYIALLNVQPVLLLPCAQSAADRPVWVEISRPR